jgi:hypothetical protein
MATDLARLSYDPARLYTGVVHQQGRVTLEAEENEQRIIDGEQRRKELLDIVGPAGTPDNGYLVAANGSQDLTIAAGTMYVGGLRLELDADITYSDQPDWLDYADDPDWVDPGRANGNNHVVLVVSERDVTAVEDPMLYEVALGGPDAAARTRLLQHIELIATGADTCAGALASDEPLWLEEGLVFDPATMQLDSASRLTVTWLGDPQPQNPCEPSSTGGYLGAENQLIRVQVTNVDSAGKFDILWGWDNASFLYRVSADASTNPILTLQRSPADDFHRPRAGQAVQVLRSAANLQSTDGVVEGYVAALNGEVGLLAAPYDPDTKTVQFPAPLPATYTDPKQTPQLYLRVWEQLITGNTLGQPITLPGTGLQVQLSLDGASTLHIGDYWSIAVRPSTPTTVYPDRYLRAPQPPDGPRMWACPLAVITWGDGGATIEEDCRHRFDPLGGNGDSGCCAVELHPSDTVGGHLQDVIDAAVAARPKGRAGQITICLAPGYYRLEGPIRLGPEHSNLELRGCSEGAILSAAAGHETEFVQGLVIADHVNNLTISGLEFVLPQVPLAAAGQFVPEQQTESFGVSFHVVTDNRYASIALRPVHCAMLEVRDCEFRFTIGDATTTPETAQTMPRSVFGVAVFAASECWGMKLERNRFLHEEMPPLNFDGGPTHILVGLLLTPSVLSGRSGLHQTGRTGPAVLRALLQDALVRDNLFDGVTVGIVVLAELGNIRIEDNVMRHCYGGIWTLDQRAQAYLDLSSGYQLNSPQYTPVGPAISTTEDLVLVVIGLLGRIYPLPSEMALATGSIWQQARPATPPKEQATPAGHAAPAAPAGQATAAEQTTPAAKEGQVAPTVPESARTAEENIQRQWTTQFLQRVRDQFTSSDVPLQAPATAESPPPAQAPPPPAAPEPAAPPARADQAPVEVLRTSADAPAGNAPQPPPAPAQASDAMIKLAQSGMLNIERGLASNRGGGRLELHVGSNVIDCAGLPRKQSGGGALIVFTVNFTAADTLVLDGNRFTALLEGPTAIVIGVTDTAITGNVIRNDYGDGASLSVLACREPAITGNVLRGKPHLPNRALSSPFDSWAPLNTVYY